MECVEDGKLEGKETENGGGLGGESGQREEVFILHVCSGAAVVGLWGRNPAPNLAEGAGEALKYSQASLTHLEVNGIVHIPI